MLGARPADVVFIDDRPEKRCRGGRAGHPGRALQHAARKRAPRWAAHGVIAAPRG